MIRTYSELIKFDKFSDRFAYLKLDGKVGSETFGSHRYLNQILYKMAEWKSVRRDVIIRDNACDLAHPDFEIRSQPIYVHHMNPITIEDIIEHRSIVFNPECLICVSHQTHEAIHYGDENLLPKLPNIRQPNDTCPWKR